MPVMGPSESPIQVDKAYNQIMNLLKEDYGIQKFEGPYQTLPLEMEERARRNERNSYFKEALRKLFQLQSWEDF